MEEQGRAIDKISVLALAVGGNLSLAGAFALALAFPLQYGPFIFRIGLWFFLIEFWNIIFSGVEKDPKIPGGLPGKIFSMGLYGFIVAVFGIFMENLFLPIYALLGFSTKVLGKKKETNEETLWIYVMLFLFTVLIITIPGAEYKLWETLFPLPPEVFQYQIEGSSGLFVDAPQNLLVWGIVYFSLSALLEGVLFYREVRFTKAP